MRSCNPSTLIGFNLTLGLQDPQKLKKQSSQRKRTERNHASRSLSSLPQQAAQICNKHFTSTEKKFNPYLWLKPGGMFSLLLSASSLTSSQES